MKGMLMLKSQGCRAGLLVCLMAVSACVANGPHRGAAVSTPSSGGVSVAYDQFAGTVDSKAFTRLDEDRSGTITPDEWQQLDRAVQATQDFEALDTDRNDEISPYEWQTNLGGSGVVLHLFQYLDANRDDYVTDDELRRNSIAAAIFSITF